ncbi:hypothetical protein [Pararobbsia alpina]|uniref:hypothetical protein n=1 Tax=Pararobbsia alpina TaxID=621374 RepID=UPI0039A6389D
MADLRDRYNADYLNYAEDVQPDLVALGALLDETFKQNALSLAVRLSGYEGATSRTKPRIHSSTG